MTNNLTKLSFFLFTILFTFGYSQNKPVESIEQILSEDGSIAPGYSGSFNAEGYTMNYGKNGEPIFKPLAATPFSWDVLGTKTNAINGTIYSLAVSASGIIYITGDFTALSGDINANRVAFWDGNSWQPLGTGLNNYVYSITVSGTDVYFGGAFTDAGGNLDADRIARWDGSNWNAIGTGLGNSVHDIAISGTDIYACGDFLDAGGNPNADRIARWDGSNWNALGIGLSGTVWDIAISGTDIYAGGDFVDAGGDINADRFAKWNGTNWSSLGVPGINTTVRAIAFSGTDIYIGGMFSNLAGIANADRIAKWDGTNWNALGLGIDTYGVYSIIVSGGDIYFGGSYKLYGNTSGNNDCIAKWDGTNLSLVGTGLRSTVTSMDLYDGKLLLGGQFASEGAYYLTVWDGTNFVEVGNPNGLNAYVKSIAISGKDIYVGGNFANAGGNPNADGIARWDGTNWNSLGSGLNSTVNKIAVSGNNLYVGGHFTNAGGIATADYIARWDGTNWNSVGGGLNAAVQAIAISGSDIYVGGNFTDAGGIATADRIAKWNGSTWSALGSGFNSSVNAVEISGDNIYAGGGFTLSGSLSCNRIAKWNGSAWSALGPNNLNGQVNTIAISGNNVFVGGGFSDVGGNLNADFIVLWNGSTWNALGTTPLSSVVNSIVVSGSDVYACGIFQNAGGNSNAKYITFWDGVAWNALGSGLTGNATTLTLFGTDLYVGGNFTSAGGNPSAFFERWFGAYTTESSANVNKPVVAGSGLVSFNSGSEITGLQISLNAGAGSGNIIASLYQDSPINVSGIADNVSNYRWIIQQNGLSASFTGEVRFMISDIPNNGIIDPTKVIVYSRPTPGRGTFTALPTSYNAGTGEIIATISGFSEFAFGGDNPLPVELNSFTASQIKNEVLINWKTATEVNNYGFEVEKKSPSPTPSIREGSLEWQKIGFIAGSGNSNSEKSYSFIDQNPLISNDPANKVNANQTILYRLKQIDNNGLFKYSEEIEVDINNIPAEFVLEQNYPNPFNPVTSIKFSLPANHFGNVTLKVYDILGNEVSTLVNENKLAGNYEVKFDASSISSGVYYYQLNAGNFVETKKMILLK